MKFLCVDCDARMTYEDRELPGDGTLAAVFRCPSCSRRTALLTNPMETQLVSSLGVKVGGRAVPTQPMEQVRTSVDEGREDAFADAGDGDPEDGAGGATAGGRARSADGTPASAGARATGAGAGAVEDAAAPRRSGPVRWSDDAVERLGRVPSFVRGMVRRIYTDWAKEHGVEEMTPEAMDRARRELGLEGM